MGAEQPLVYMPHGHCYFWDPLILWMQNASDGAIALAYFTIPASLLYFVRRRPSLHFKWIYVLFASFILWCGLTHVFDIITTWRGVYLAQAVVKVVTAAVSVTTAVLLIPLIPAALALRTPRELEEAYGRLEAEVQERRRAEEELRQLNQGLEKRIDQELEIRRDALAASNTELERFAYAASHDLKAPLRAVLNLSRWIEEDLGQAPNPVVAEHLRQLGGTVRRMGRMLDDLLEYSRVGRQDDAVVPTDLGALCQDLVEMLPQRPGLRIEVEPGLPSLQAARAPLRQVLMNLLSNAVKHHDKAEGWVKVQARDLGDEVEISVSDDGPGIDPRYHRRIFEIFQTLRPHDEVEGNGIGLALVKKIVEQRGGRVELISAPGSGSQFKVTWPKGT